MHPPRIAALRHFLMHDARTGGHPLHVACTQQAGVAQRIAVLDRAVQHIGDGFDAPVRMPWETFEVIIGALVPKIVEQQEWIQLARVLKAERAVQFDASALHGGLSCAGLNSWSEGHDRLLSSVTLKIGAGSTCHNVAGLQDIVQPRTQVAAREVPQRS